MPSNKFELKGCGGSLGNFTLGFSEHIGAIDHKDEAETIFAALYCRLPYSTWRELEHLFAFVADNGGAYETGEAFREYLHEKARV